MRDCTLDNVSHENTTPGTIIFTKSTMMNNDDDVITCSARAIGMVLLMMSTNSRVDT